MRVIKVYAEGGGETRNSKRAISAGLKSFLERLGSTRVRVVACGSRDEARDAFRHALCRRSTDDHCLLLVDSEGPVAKADTQKKHLIEHYKWQIDGAAEAQCHLMVQMMEAWFLADRETLARLYGRRFTVNALPKRRDVEEVPKADVESALKEATRHTPKRECRKIRDASRILEKLDPDKVTAAAPHCARLRDALVALRSA